jgi:hypothetical protein
MNCLDCGRGPLIAYTRWRAGHREGVEHKARGLCGRCYQYRRRHNIPMPPATRRPPADHTTVIQQWQQLRDEGLSMTATAARIGIGRTALYGHLARDGRHVRLPDAELARLRREVGVA